MDIFSALAEPTRREIMEILATRGQLTATDICDRFPVSAPAISQHLKILRDTNLVIVEKQAQKRLYRMNPVAISELETWVDHITKLWNDRFDRLEDVLKLESAKRRACLRSNSSGGLQSRR